MNEAGIKRREGTYFATLQDGWRDVTLEVKSDRLVAVNGVTGEEVWYSMNGTAFRLVGNDVKKP